MTVRIFGQEYKGLDGYKELEARTAALFPGRDLDAAAKTPTGKAKKRGEASIIEWLRHRNEHANQRVANGLPARKAPPPKQKGPGDDDAEAMSVDDDGVSVLSMASSAETSTMSLAQRQQARALLAAERPLHHELVALDCYPAWHQAVPQFEDGEAHLQVLEELSLFTPTPPPEDDERAATASSTKKGHKKGSSRVASPSGSSSSSSSSRKSTSPSRKQLAAAARPHMVGLSGKLKPLNESGLCWNDVDKATRSRDDPPIRDPFLGVPPPDFEVALLGAAGAGNSESDSAESASAASSSSSSEEQGAGDEANKDVEEVSWRPLGKVASLLEAVGFDDFKEIAALSALTREAPPAVVVLAVLRRGKSSVLSACATSMAALGLEDHPGELSFRTEASPPKPPLSTFAALNQLKGAAAAAAKQQKKASRYSKQMSVSESAYPKAVVAGDSNTSSSLGMTQQWTSGVFPNIVDPLVRRRCVQFSANELAKRLDLDKFDATPNTMASSKEVASPLSKYRNMRTDRKRILDTPPRGYSPQDLAALRLFVELNRKYFPPTTEGGETPFKATLRRSLRESDFFATMNSASFAELLATTPPVSVTARSSQKGDQQPGGQEEEEEDPSRVQTPETLTAPPAVADDDAPRPPLQGPTSLAAELPMDKIKSAFLKHDSDQSGDLNTFELANTMAELFGRSFSTKQVMAMVDYCGEDAKANRLTLPQFVHLVKTFDWEAETPRVLKESMDRIYEYVFEKEQLGFGVRNDAEKGTLVVSRVVDESLRDTVIPNDRVLAVNGAPLGYVTDHRVLQAKVRPLRRPVRITFERYYSDPSMSERATSSLLKIRPQTNSQLGTTAFGATVAPLSTVGDAELSARALNAISELSVHDIEKTFHKHDSNALGNLDTFQLANAMAELVGRPLSTKHIMAMVESFGDDAKKANSLTLHEFVTLVKDFDWKAETPRILKESKERIYDYVFEKEQLGFGVKNDVREGTLIVSRVVDESIRGLVIPNDRVLAVNGAPLGHVTDHRVLQEKVRPLRRPIRITFERYHSDPSMSERATSSLLKIRPQTNSQLGATAFGATVAPLSTVGDAELSTRALITLTELSVDDIEKTFHKHDSNALGNLDTFQLANAMAELVGRPLSTKHIMAMVESFGDDAKKANSLTLHEFVTLVKDFDWKAETPRILKESKERIYDYVFEKEQLGFGVKNDVREGTLIVSRVVDESIRGLVIPNDRVLAVNGAPLGHVTDHRVLQAKVRPLRRPVRITFERYQPDPSMSERATSSLLKIRPQTQLGFPLLTSGFIEAQFSARALEALSELPMEAIEKTFHKHDTDASGNLDTFQLANAMAELVGRPLSTKHIMAMVESFGDDAKKANSLTLVQFSTLVRDFDWKAETPRILKESMERIYEHVFEKEQLGFGVRNNEKGALIVSRVVDSSLRDVVIPNDRVLAVNGAPLGHVTDHRVLQAKVRPLRRPVRITFERYYSDPSMSERATSSLLKIRPQTQMHIGASDLSLSTVDDAELSARALNAISDLPMEAIEKTFHKHDTDASGNLDTFQLANAMAELVGRPLSTKHIMAMVESFGDDAKEENSLTLPQFVNLVRDFDWKAETPRILKESKERIYDYVFEKEQLGFGVKNDVREGTLIVSRIFDESIRGFVVPNDRILAVNGAPLGHVTDHRVLQAKVRPLRRPIRITFERPSSSTDDASAARALLSSASNDDDTTLSGSVALSAPEPRYREESQEAPTTGDSVAALSTEPSAAPDNTSAFEPLLISQESTPQNSIEADPLSTASSPRSTSLLENLAAAGDDLPGGESSSSRRSNAGRNSSGGSGGAFGAGDGEGGNGGNGEDGGGGGGESVVSVSSTITSGTNMTAATYPAVGAATSGPVVDDASSAATSPSKLTVPSRASSHGGDAAAVAASSTRDSGAGGTGAGGGGAAGGTIGRAAGGDSSGGVSANNKNNGNGDDDGQDAGSNTETKEEEEGGIPRHSVMWRRQESLRSAHLAPKLFQGRFPRVQRMTHAELVEELRTVHGVAVPGYDDEVEDCSDANDNGGSSGGGGSGGGSSGGGSGGDSGGGSGGCGNDKPPAKVFACPLLLGRPLLARVFALKEQAGHTLLHLATHLGHSGCALLLLEKEDVDVGRRDLDNDDNEDGGGGGNGGGYGGGEEGGLHYQSGVFPSPRLAFATPRSSSSSSPSKARSSPTSRKSPPSAATSLSGNNGSGAEQGALEENEGAAAAVAGAAAAAAAAAAVDDGWRQLRPGLRRRRMLDGRDALGRTPLHLACATRPHFRLSSLVKALLLRGADVHARDCGGRTPLHVACLSADEAAIALLLASGADPCAQTFPRVMPADSPNAPPFLNSGPVAPGCEDFDPTAPVPRKGRKSAAKKRFQKVVVAVGITGWGAGAMRHSGSDGSSSVGSSSVGSDGSSGSSSRSSLRLRSSSLSRSPSPPPIEPPPPPPAPPPPPVLPLGLAGTVNGGALELSKDALLGGGGGGFGSAEDRKRPGTLRAGASSSGRGGRDFGTILGGAKGAEGAGGSVFPGVLGGTGGCLIPLQCAAPERRAEVYSMLVSGLTDKEVRAMHAKMMARPLVAEVLQKFVLFDSGGGVGGGGVGGGGGGSSVGSSGTGGGCGGPAGGTSGGVVPSYRSLHKSHAQIKQDFAYHLMVTGRLPRGNWSDLRPGEKPKKPKKHGKK